MLNEEQEILKIILCFLLLQLPILLILKDKRIQNLLISFFIKFFKVEKLKDYYIGEEVMFHENCFIDLHGYINSFYKIFGKEIVAVDCTREDLKNDIFVPRQISLVDFHDIISLDKKKIRERRKIEKDRKMLFNLINTL